MRCLVDTASNSTGHEHTALLGKFVCNGSRAVLFSVRYDLTSTTASENNNIKVNDYFIGSHVLCR